MSIGKYDVGITDAEGNEIKGVADSISFEGDVERSGYVGVETGKLSFSVDVLSVSDVFARMFLGKPKTFEQQCDECYRRKDREGLLLKVLSEHWLLPIAVDRKAVEERIRYAIRLLNAIPCGYKLRKTTYRTIRRDCAKRNRHK